MQPDLTIRSAAAVLPDADERFASVTEDTIRRLVHGFYGEIQTDSDLGPIFNREIAPERWPTHLEKMCAFWSSVILRTQAYNGRPMQPHLRLDGLSDRHFQCWLNLFGRAARRAFDPIGAAAVTEIAERIAYSFRLGIAFHQGVDSIGMRPQKATTLD